MITPSSFSIMKKGRPITDSSLSAQYIFGTGNIRVLERFHHAILLENVIRLEEALALGTGAKHEHLEPFRASLRPRDLDGEGFLVGMSGGQSPQVPESHRRRLRAEAARKPASQRRSTFGHLAVHVSFRHSIRAHSVKS